MKGKKSKREESKKPNNWPVTYRIMAMGTLVAYSALGGSKMSLAAPGNGNKESGNGNGQQALLVRRFEIPEGTLDTVLAAFEKTTGIHVNFAEEGIKSLHSEGVTGLYSPDQALKKIFADSGVVYRFTSADSVNIELAGMATSIEVTGDTVQILDLPKYTELLRDTPQTVNVVNQQTMLEQGVTTLRDALRNVAGISLAAGEGGAQGDNLTIRGFSARNDIFLDGMRDFGSYYRDPFNYETVAVLQGPTSVTFGRGSTGGVVNQESKVPEVGHFVTGNLQFGSDMTRRVTADVNQSLGQTTAFRLNVMGHDSEVSERHIAETRRFGVAPSLAFGLGTSTRLTLSYLHEQADDNPDYGIPWLFNGPAPVTRTNYYGFEHGNFLRTNDDIGTIKAEHDFNSNFTLRNQVRYGHYKRDAQITEAKILTSTTPETPLDNIQVTRNQIAVSSLESYFGDQLDATIRFNTGKVKHALVAGVEAARETSSPWRYSFLTAPNPSLPDVVPVPQTSLLNPDEQQPFAGTRLLNTDTHAISNSVGAYVVDTIKVNRKLDLIGGIRWDRFDTDYLQLTYKQTDQSAPPTQVALSQVDNKPSYRAAIVYKPKSYGSIYFDYGTSFNPSAESLSLSTATAGLPPENNRTFEVGTKWDLPSRKLSVAASIFRSEKLNAREPSQNDPTVNDLAGTQRVNGVQVAVTGRITRRWQMLSSYAYLDGKLVSSKAFPNAVGAQLANVPKNTFNMWTTYELPWKFTFGGGTQFVDSRTASSTVPLDPATGLVKRIPSYWVFNAMASHPLTENISLQINLYNLANRYYFDEPHPGHIVPGAGFTALGGVNFRF